MLISYKFDLSFFCGFMEIVQVIIIDVAVATILFPDLFQAFLFGTNILSLPSTM